MRIVGLGIDLADIDRVQRVLDRYPRFADRVFTSHERAYALTDNPETRNQILFKLRQLQARSVIDDVVRVVEHEWRSRYPFLSRSAALLVGPRRDPARCAGPHSHRDLECPEDWTAAIGTRGAE